MKTLKNAVIAVIVSFVIFSGVASAGVPSVSKLQSIVETTFSNYEQLLGCYRNSVGGRKCLASDSAEREIGGNGEPRITSLKMVYNQASYNGVYTPEVYGFAVEIDGRTTYEVVVEGKFFYVYANGKMLSNGNVWLNKADTYHGVKLMSVAGALKKLNNAIEQRLDYY